MSFDSHRHPERYPPDPAARAFSHAQLEYIARAEAEMETENEETGEIEIQELPTCAEIGHQPTLVIADNGFTYEWVCRRCGRPTTA